MRDATMPHPSSATRDATTTLAQQGHHKLRQRKPVDYLSEKVVPQVTARQLKFHERHFEQTNAMEEHSKFQLVAPEKADDPN